MRVEALLLTERQLTIVNLLFQGRNYAQIAEALGANYHTVRSDLHRVYKMRGVSNPIQLLCLVWKNGGVLY